MPSTLFTPINLNFVIVGRIESQSKPDEAIKRIDMSMLHGQQPLMSTCFDKANMTRSLYRSKAK